jgi:hypothetical protein
LACHCTLRLEVREQRKPQLAVLRECLVTPDPVNRNAQQLGAERLKLGEDLVVQRHLVAAHRTPIRRIKR